METSEMISAYKDIVAETIQSGSNGEYNVVAAKFLNDMGKVLETMLSLEGAVGSKTETIDYDALLGKFTDEN
jgi:hypothetical protein